MQEESAIDEPTDIVDLSDSVSYFRPMIPMLAKWLSRFESHSRHLIDFIEKLGLDSNCFNMYEYQITDTKIESKFLTFLLTSEERAFNCWKYLLQAIDKTIISSETILSNLLDCLRKCLTLESDFPFCKLKWMRFLMDNRGFVYRDCPPTIRFMGKEFKPPIDCKLSCEFRNNTVIGFHVDEINEEIYAQLFLFLPSMFIHSTISIDEERNEGVFCYITDPKGNMRSIEMVMKKEQKLPRSKEDPFFYEMETFLTDSNLNTAEGISTAVACFENVYFNTNNERFERNFNFKFIGNTNRFQMQLKENTLPSHFCYFSFFLLKRGINLEVTEQVFNDFYKERFDWILEFRRRNAETRKKAKQKANSDKVGEVKRRSEQILKDARNFDRDLL